MKIAILADDAGKKEWMARGFREDAEITWLENRIAVPGASAYIDLLFDESSVNDNNNAWQEAGNALVFVNDVLKPHSTLPQNYIRFNGWPSFTGRKIMEAAEKSEPVKTEAETVMAACNCSMEWVADIPGFISARVVSMIINEAWYALQENVSTKEETDTAMKLGTNYPYGPFEWGEKIGLHNVYHLLNILAAGNSRYTPCTLITAQAIGK